jgi:FKBP-type peptidyl-prolyl cis-trans isomerase FkpA
MADVAGEVRPVLSTGLRYLDIRTGNGPLAAGGNCVTVHYTGYRQNGQFVETSRDSVPGKPGEGVSFILGGGSVIRGWDLGIPGMKVGGVRRLFVPSELGYGSKGAGSRIPPNVNLVFDVELMAADARQAGYCS